MAQSTTLPQINEPAFATKSIHEGLAQSKVDKPLTPFLRNNKAFGRPPNKGCIPGYQGFIRGSQHFYGSTYGEMTRNASEHDFGTTFYGSPVEEQPNMVSHPFEEPEDGSPKYRLPGYAGYVPGSKFEFSKTFGDTTKALVKSMEEKADPPGSIPRVITTDTTEMPNAKHTIVRSHEKSADTKRPQTSPVKTRKQMMMDPPDEASQIPGYAGFIRGQQHFYGSTYGKMTKATTGHDFRKPTVTKGLPDSPHMVNIDPADLPADRPPGYGGHVPGSKFEYAKTFGETSNDLICNFKKTV